MFPLSFPYEALRSASQGSRVLDPFCGRGTTAYAARLRRLPFVGIDTNPVAVAIAKAKLIRIASSKVIERCQELLEPVGSVDVPEGEFWDLAFNPATLRNLCTLRQRFESECSAPVDVALRAIVLGILHGPLTKGRPTYLSNQMPRTYATKPAGAIRFWTSRSMRPPAVDLLDAVRRRATFVLREQPGTTAGEVVEGDARIVDLRRGGPRFDWVVTSPPYYGMYTYYADQWLRAWFLGGSASPSEGAIPQIGHGSRGEFQDSLARAWSAVADACRPGAHLVVRFGNLPSSPTDPTEMLTGSLTKLGRPWQITRIRSAGKASGGKRQAVQFGGKLGTDTDEIDLEACLGA